jgi:TP901 family phage tail tape measure protein
MVGQNKTFNATVVGKVDIQAGDATKLLQSLVALQKDMTEGFKKTANEARNAFEKVSAAKDNAELIGKLNTALRAMSKELKNIKTVDSGINIVKDQDIKKANELLTQMNQLARVYKDMQKQAGIEKGNFGLDTKSAKEGIRQLKELEKAAQAVQQAMSMKGDADGSLQKYKTKIEANTKALNQHIDALRNAVTMEKAHEQALAANAARDSGIRASRRKMEEAEALRARQAELKQIEANAKGFEKAERDKNLALKAALEERRRMQEDAALKQNQLLGRQAAERKRLEDAEALRSNLALKAKQEMQYKLLNSAAAQGRALREGLDLSAAGRAAGQFQFQQLSNRTSLLANPAFQQQEQARRQRQIEENALKSVYQQANVKPETSGFYKVAASDTGNAARVQAAQTILSLQKQLTDLQMKGQLSDAESLRLRNAISAAIAQEVQARNRAGNQQAQQNQADRNMARIGGIGGASLMAVQASLMANYSLLNSFTGSIRSAITTSVELEAAFRNVQAVTATTRTEMTGLEEKIKATAAASKFTSIEVAGAALTLGQAGLTARQVGESIQSVTMLASAAGTNLAQAVDLVTSVIGVYDKKASETADIANKITAAANSSKVSVEKLALGFQYAGNTAAQMGVSFEETTAAMAAMSNAGIKSGSTMGTGLRQFLVETQKPSEEFIATISRIGLTMADLDFKSNGLIGVARKLREAGFIASDAIKSFDVRGAAAFNALIANPDDMENQYRLLLNTQAGMKANEIQMDSLKSQSTRLTTSLGNLAVVGFEPLGSLLTVIADKMATGIQLMSEYKTTVMVLGGLLSGVLISGLVVYTSTLVSGALALLGVSTASMAAARSLTILGASQAVLGTMTAAWTGLRAAVMAGAAAYTIAASQGVVATTLLGSAMAGLTAITRGLMVAIGGLSIMTGIGIIIGAAAIAYYALTRASSEAREEMDKMQAASAEAKGEFTSTQDTVNSLTNKITELNYKSQDASLAQQDLTTTGMALQSQFGNIGFAANETTKTYSGMISKLKELRGEMRLLADEKLKLAVDENTKLQVLQNKTATEELDTLRKKGAIRNIDIALDPKNSKFSTDSQKEKLRSAREQIIGGNAIDAKDLPDVAAIATKIAEGFRKEAKGATTGPNAGNAMLLEGLAQNVNQFARARTELLTSRAEGAGLGVIQANSAASREYDKRTINVGGQTLTVEQIKEQLGGNFRGRNKPTGDKLRDFDNAYVAAQAEIAKLETVIDQLEKDRDDPKFNRSVVIDNLTAVRGLAAGLKRDITQSKDETQAKAKRKYDDEARVLKALTQDKSTSKAAQAQAIKDLATLDKKFKTRGILDLDEKYLAEQSIEETGDIRARSKLASGGNRRVQDVGSEVRQRMYKLQEAQLLREANTLKGDAALSGDAEVSKKLLDEGVKKVIKAGDKAIEAARAKQAIDLANAPIAEREGLSESFRAEITAIRADFAERAKQFIMSFKGFSGAAAESLRAMEDTLNKQKQGLTDKKFANEERIYEESAALRQLEREAALGKRTKVVSGSTTSNTYSTNSGLEVVKGNVVGIDNYKNSNNVRTTFGPAGVSVSTRSTGGTESAYGGATNTTRANGAGKGVSVEGTISQIGTLKQRMANEIIRVTRIELQQNQEFIESLGQVIQTLNTTLQTATAEYEKNQKELDELQALQKANGGVITEAQRARMSELKDALPKQREAVTEAQKDLNSTQKDRRSARKDGESLEVRIAENTKVLPQEMSLKNIGVALDNVWAKWEETVGNMDAIAVIENGMEAILGNITGNLATVFTSLVDGTKSVKDAFKDMATGIIKAMLDIVSQAMAMQAIEGLMNLAGSFMGGGGASNVAPRGIASGGYINMEGRLERVKAYATGGPVRGGKQGRDSVPAILMPGEFVLKKTAVDAVGSDYLHSLNQASNSVVSSSTSKGPGSEEKGQGSVVNVWVVSPDQQPNTMGPKDIVVAISDDIIRGGSVKKLIKQVMTNQI